MSGRVTGEFLEALVGGAPRAIVSREFLEVLIPAITRSPTTVTGAGVSLVRGEALVAGTVAARVSGEVVEVLVADTTPAAGGGAPTPVTRTFGYAV